MLRKILNFIVASYAYDRGRIKIKFFIFIFNVFPTFYGLRIIRNFFLRISGFNFGITRMYFRGKIFADCPKRIYMRSGYLNWNISFEGGGRVFIGRNCKIAPNVSFVTSDHKQEETKNLNIRIGDNVWIGANSVVIGGARIDDNVIIAAGSVVPKGEYYYRGSRGGGIHCMLEIQQDMLRK